MPDWKPAIRRYLEASDIPAGLQADIEEELSQHLELRYLEAVSSGVDAADAELSTLNELSGAALSQTLERLAVHDRSHRLLPPSSSSGGGLRSLAHDIRYALRRLRLSPLFTIAALLSLALGIGADTAIFEIFNALRLRSLPIPHPEELVEVHTTEMSGARGSFYATRPVLTDPQWKQLRDRKVGVDGLFAWYRDEFNTSSSGQSHLVDGIEVSGSYFSTLEVRPVLGRLIADHDDTPGCGSPTAVLSYRYWKNAFGAAPDVIGQKMTIEKHSFQIIGVAASTFSGLDVGRGFDVAVPLCAEPMLMGEYNRLNSGRDWWLTVMGRLHPGVSLQQVNSQLESISPTLFGSTVPPNYPPDAVKAYGASKLAAYSSPSGVSDLRRDYSAPLTFLLCIAALVVLIACANLANLLLARAAIREREFSIRLALGASRSRLVRQQMAESAIIAFGGVLAGIGVAAFLSHYLVTFLQTRSIHVYLDVRPDYRVLLFAIGFASVTCLLFGLLPALRAAKADPGSALKSAARNVIGQRNRFGMRRFLVMAQVAISTMLVLAALLFTKNLAKLYNVDAGFEQDGLFVASIDLSAAKIPKEQRLAYRRQLIERLKSAPGIDNATETVIRPLSGGGWDDNAWIESRGQSNQKDSWFNRVGPEYFETMRIPLMSGRHFQNTDTPASPPVAVVNEAFVRMHLGSEDAIGKTVATAPTPYSPAKKYQIVGVARNAKYRSLKEAELPQVYLATSQDQDPSAFTRILVRSHLAAADLQREMDAIVTAAAPQSTVVYRNLREDVKDSFLRERLMATLSIMFGVLATILATVGLYGVLSYMLARRTNEIGIRMALGASRSGVLNLIFRESAKLITFGLSAGVLLAMALGRSIAALLFGTTPYDPAVIALACTVLTAVGMTAAAIPAFRAVKLNPISALREE